MPNLKQISCAIELGPNDTQLKEYGHRYTDGGVEAFVAIPESDIPFQVHVTSNGYIAPGLAAYLFIDGQYQCNRNRQRLQVPSPGMSPLEYEIDFKLRQREEKTSEGQFVAREWTFSRLQTSNADLAPNINANFAKNVGTIEIVLLRCTGGDGAGSGEDLTDTAGAPAGAKVTLPARSPSIRKAAPKEKAATKVPSKAASKVASRAASRAPAKQESEGGSLGGMMGLFDGAGDHPGYPSYSPRYARDPQPSPGYHRAHRDDRYDPRPCRAPPRHEYEDAYDPRPRTAPGRYPLQSPMGGYDYQERHRATPRFHARVPEVRPTGRVFYPPPAQANAQARYDSEPEGFSFIQELCRQIDDLMRLQFDETQKCNQLYEEAHKNRHDSTMQYAAAKAARGAEQALGSLQEELNALWASLVSRMNRMDEAAWNFVRDYVVLERRLIPMSHPQFQQWRDPRLQQYTDSTPNTQTAQANAERDQGWQEVGQGQTGGGGLAARKRAEQDGWKRNGQGNKGWAQGAPVDEIDRQADARRAERDKGKANDGWNDDKRSNNDGKSQRSGKTKTDAWPNDNNDNDKGNDNWNQNGGSTHSQSNRSRSRTQSQGWGGQGDNGGDNNAWGGGGNDGSKSQTAESKVNSWNNDGGGGGGDNAGGWGNQDDHKSKANDGGGGWGGGSKAASDHPSRTSRRPDRKGAASTICEPVIKPYWADWNKPDDNAGKLRAKPREPYEYPALPPPIAATGKASSVNYGVQAGRGANYTHKTYRPEYLDTMQKPYAIFTFKYRSQAALEKILKRKIDTGEVQRAILEAEKNNLMAMPKDELVSNMMKMKLKGGAGSGKGPAKSTTKAASKAGSKNNNGWGQDAGGGGGGWNDGGRDEVKPSDSASQWGGNDDNDNQNDQDGWGGNNNDGGGGGDNWAADEKKSSSRKSKGGGGGGGGWGDDDNANGGNDAWDKDNKTEEHFAGDAGLQQTGGQQKVSNSRADAGW